jgi:hypothetical protein
MTQPGTHVLGLSITGGAGTATAAALPFTGLPVSVISMIMAAMLAIAVGVALLRMAKLGVAERRLDAPRFTS